MMTFVILFYLFFGRMIFNCQSIMCASMTCQKVVCVCVLPIFIMRTIDNDSLFFHCCCSHTNYQLINEIELFEKFFLSFWLITSSSLGFDLNLNFFFQKKNHHLYYHYLFDTFNKKTCEL